MLTPSLLVALSLLAETESDSALQVARAVIDHQEESIRTWIAEYSCDIRARSPLAGGKTVQQSQKYRETRRGPLYRRHTELNLDASVSSDVQKDQQTFDGEVYRSYSAEHKAGGISSEGTEPTCLTQSLYLSTQGLGAMLREHADDAEAKWVNSGGRRLLSVSWDENGGYSRRTLHLDPDAAYQPRWFSLETEYPEGAYPDGRERGILVGEINEFLHRDEVVIPSVVVVTNEETYPQDRTLRTMEKEVQILSMDLNPELDDAEFTIEFPDGTTVRDKDRKVKYVVGQPGSEEPLDAPSRIEEPVPQPGPTYELWADWRVWLGFSVLCLGLLIWVKRKGLA